MLDEATALRLTIAWGKRLARHKRFTVLADSATQFPGKALIRVHFQFKDPRYPAKTQDHIAYVRECLAVWRAVASCPGFSCSENPDFWTRVVFASTPSVNRKYNPFEEVRESECSPGITIVCCVDGVIRRENRVQLLRWVGEVCGGLLNWNGEPQEASSTSFYAALKRLEPFQDARRCNSVSVLLELQIKNDHGYDGTVEYLHVVQAILDQSTPKAAQAANSRDATARNDRDAVFTLTGIWIAQLVIKASSHADALNGVLTSMSEDLSWTGLSLKCHSCIDRTTAGQTARAILCPEAFTQTSLVPEPPQQLHLRPTLGKIRFLVLRSLSGIDPQVFACFCSALPFTRSLQTLQLESENAECPWMLSEAATRWLAHTIFHPQTKSSTWKKLVMKGCGFDANAKPVIANMRLNPFALLSASRLARVMAPQRKFAQRVVGAVDHEELQIARITAGAVARTEPNAASAIVSTLKNYTEWLQICDHQASGWYRVLIPGYGFGWVDDQDTLELRDWIPRASLTPGLTSFERNWSNILEAIFLDFLGGIGECLKTLRLHAVHPIANLLDSVSKLCPKLEQLQLGGERLALSKGSLLRFFSKRQTKLQSLTLDWEPDTIRALSSVLTRSPQLPAVPRLQRLHLRNVEALPGHGADFAAMFEANKFLEELVFSSQHAVVDDPENLPNSVTPYHGELLALHEANARRHYAFLGVVNRLLLKPGSVFRCLDSFLLAIIFRFATTRVRRSVRFFPPPDRPPPVAP